MTVLHRVIDGCTTIREAIGAAACGVLLILVIYGAWSAFAHGGLLLALLFLAVVALALYLIGEPPQAEDPNEVNADYDALRREQDARIAKAQRDAITTRYGNQHGREL